jgi:hypothetical protein
LWNDYTRITLVSKGRAERVTIDLNLAFTPAHGCTSTPPDGRTQPFTGSASLPGIVVAEVKYGGSRQDSEFVRLMRAYHVRATSFSKYCVGVSLIYPAVKHNRFKAKQRLVERIAQG